MASKRSRKAYEEDLRRTESPFVVYGTPLPPLDDDVRDDGSFVPVWKQEVTDDRGRKRLHGAFTGGFSAGYFNTVGSKEGWTPSTFVSSRSNRAKDQKNNAQSRPEDFMDDEDIQEQEESRHLSTTSGFAGFGTEDDPMHKNALMDLFKPSADSMGVKLLNKMGWKQGHGIGPRIRRRVKGEGDEDSETHLFAPDDVPMVSFNKKHDFKGLDYDGEAGSLVLGPSQVSKAPREVHQSDGEDEDGRPGLSFMANKKKPNKANRAGFGVGVLNDTGSDEEDPYSMGPRISYNKTLGSDKKAKKKATSTFGTANPLLKSKPTFIPKKLSSMQHALRKCHDGRLPLTGFVLADELDSFSSMSLTDEKYKPPKVPPGWKPTRLPSGSLDNLTGDQKPAAYQSTSDAAKQSTHTSATRAALLGEKELPGKSIFDFLTPEARDKLMKATGKTNLPPALSERVPGVQGDSYGKIEETAIDVPYLDAVTAKSALSRADSGGFMPYAEDLDKRGRYKHFLELSAGRLPDGTLPMKPSSTARNEEWLNELYEFVRAAEVFRPMTGAIASRFTSSTSTTLDPAADNAFDDSNDSSNSNSNGSSNPLLRKPVSKPEDPAEVAAKLGMFGIMTRTVSSFQPGRLVCKRFGVDMPIYMPQETTRRQFTSTFTPNAMTTTTTISPARPDLTTSSSQSASNVTNQFKSAGFITDGKSHPDTQEPRNANDEEKKISVAAAVPTGTVTADPSINPDQNDALERERPGQAVFQAIFGDTDSDEE